ncbi:regulatory protein [Salmonella enterica subsp. enterica serovar Choleraesuis]|nr:regulatory protein [Salmonella enterica subsp. enterica serovar Choleraesuis]
MAKPTSSQCNLGCRYCFYLEKERQPRMDDRTLERFIQQHIAAQPGNIVEFAWQGGEPTLAGLDFYRKVVELQQRYGNGKHIQNSLQTNGILLSDEWCQFLRNHGWLVGISIDGPADLHDHYRVTQSGKPTHQKVAQAISRLRAWGVEFNLLVVINALNAQYPERMYRYLTSLGTPFIQFIPLVEQDAEGNHGPASVPAAAWGKFLTTVFDLWVMKDIGQIFIQIFDSTLGVWSGHAAQMCSLAETCGHAFALEANGDLYQCDHFVYPAYLLGNLHRDSLAEINNSQTAQRFADHKRKSLSEECLRCDVRRLCQGDCPKHRQDNGKSVLCAGYRHFFDHTAPYMRVMRDLMAQRRSPMELMDILHSSHHGKSA